MNCIFLLLLVCFIISLLLLIDINEFLLDMLQPYNIRKQMEYNIKSLRYGQGISVIPPVQYLYSFLFIFHHFYYSFIIFIFILHSSVLFLTFIHICFHLFFIPLFHLIIRIIFNENSYANRFLSFIQSVVE